MNIFFSIIFLIWIHLRERYNYYCNLYYLYYHVPVVDNKVECCTTSSWASLLKCSMCKKNIIGMHCIYISVDCSNHYYCLICYLNRSILISCQRCDFRFLRKLFLLPATFNILEHHRDFERRERERNGDRCEIVYDNHNHNYNRNYYNGNYYNNDEDWDLT